MQARTVEPLRLKIVQSFPHDPGAFTQGLVYHEARLYESTGLVGRSSVRRVDPSSGAVEAQTALPADLSGQTVLEIGCNAGFYSMEMKRRGAGRVVGIDTDARYLAQARFAAEYSGLDIEFRQLSVYDVASLG